MSRMSTPGGKRPKYRFEVTEHRDEDNPQRLAVQLAQALSDASRKKVDADAFLFASRAERQKAQQIQGVIFQLEERERNPVPNVSRMDPLNEYDIDTCREELKGYKTRAIELQIESDDMNQEATVARGEAARLQRRLHEIGNKLNGS